jgi:hypothetical protein
LLIPGRWVQFIAGAKGGKSSVVMFMVVELSEGRHPFDQTAQPPVKVLYLDGEMGLRDLRDLIEDLGHTDPAKLTNLTCVVERPRLDTKTGADRLMQLVDRLGPDVVVLEGLNGFIAVDADENSTPTWRAVYEYTVEPLKKRGIAVVSEDNMGKESARGSRGSSVKSDKGDGVIEVRETDNGARLKTIYSRAGAYVAELHLNAEGFDRSKPIRYWRTATSWPAGTAAAVKVLDSLGIPRSDGRNKVRTRLHAEVVAAEAAGHSAAPFRIGNDVCPLP